MASIRTVSYRSTLSYPAMMQAGEVKVPLGISDKEFAEDMALLRQGKMSPEEHRAYILRKYGQDF